MSLQNTMNGRFAAFLPSVEVDLGIEIFLPDNPWTLLKSGKIANVPVMAGITADESAFFVQSNHQRDIMRQLHARCHINDIKIFVSSDAWQYRSDE